MKRMRLTSLHHTMYILLLEVGVGLVGMSHAFQEGGQQIPKTPLDVKQMQPLIHPPPRTINHNDADEKSAAFVRGDLRPKRWHKTGPPRPPNHPSEMQQRAGAISASFEPESFDPLISNNHVQTIGGFLLRDTPAAFVPRDNPIGAVSRIVQGLASKFLLNQQQQQQMQAPPQDESTSRTKFWSVRERIETPDGDWFHSDTLFPTLTSKEQAQRNVTVLLLHGLESNSDSVLSHQMAAAFAAQGMTVTCLNFRSCSQNEAGEFIPNDSLGGYHLGFTDDLLHYLEIMRSRSPHMDIYLSGFSLGANVVLKALGEMGEHAACLYNIQGAAVACAPFKQESNYVLFNRPGINQIAYRRGLLKKMKDKARRQLERHCQGDENTSAFDYRRAVDAETIQEFEDAFLAPIYGFDSFMDYYQKTSCIHFLESIAVPTLILNAADDPFFDPTVNPTEKSIEHGGAAPIKLVWTPHGGHLGYCFHCVSSDDKRLDNGASDTDEQARRQSTSWMPLELARFLQHVETFTSATTTTITASSSSSVQ